MTEIDGEEFAWWMAYDQIDPIGQEREDLRTAMICTTMAQAHGAKDARVEDFILRFEPEPELTQQERIAAARAAMATMRTRGKRK